MLYHQDLHVEPVQVQRPRELLPVDCVEVATAAHRLGDEVVVATLPSVSEIAPPAREVGVVSGIAVVAIGYCGGTLDLTGQR